MTVLAPGRNVVLAGMMGSGKTSVGRLLAERLGRPFRDTDTMVCDELGASVPEIFAEHGERGFREAEAVAVRAVSAVKGQVIAVGGGAVVDPANVTALRSTGEIIVLDAEPAELAARVTAQEGSRPLLAGVEDPIARLGELRGQRHNAYRSAAAVIFDTTGKSPEEIADEIIAWAVHRPGLLTREEREA